MYLIKFVRSPDFFNARSSPSSSIETWVLISKLHSSVSLPDNLLHLDLNMVMSEKRKCLCFYFILFLNE